jgi:putative SOS response-associated peptidase YedK
MHRHGTSAPTDNLPIVRYNEKTGLRTLDMMRWGLVPYWAKDKIGFSTIIKARTYSDL